MNGESAYDVLFRVHAYNLFFVGLNCSDKNKLILLNVAVHWVVPVTLFIAQDIRISIHRPPILKIFVGFLIPAW
jgi:hypothetical protein